MLKKHFKIYNGQYRYVINEAFGASACDNIWLINAKDISPSADGSIWEVSESNPLKKSPKYWIVSSCWKQKSIEIKLIIE